jgi:hypothetical protein
MCDHIPQCPDPGSPDRDAARVVITHPEQGWSLLCNGVVVFDDTGQLLPNGVALAPHGPMQSGPVLVAHGSPAPHAA